MIPIINHAISVLFLIVCFISLYFAYKLFLYGKNGRQFLNISLLSLFFSLLITTDENTVIKFITRFIEMF
jgi:hypothetical protein